MLNANLYAGMKIVVREGKSVCTTVFNTAAPTTLATEGAAPAPPPDASTKAVMTCAPGAWLQNTSAETCSHRMLRFKSSEEADNLKQLMEGCLAK